jgi:hypothetical protein
LHSGQARHHFQGFSLLLWITLFHDFGKNIPRTLVVTHIDIGLGQIEFGGGLIGARQEVELRLIIGKGLLQR